MPPKTTLRLHWLGGLLRTFNPVIVFIPFYFTWSKVAYDWSATIRAAGPLLDGVQACRWSHLWRISADKP
jgi:hypothetical protein